MYEVAAPKSRLADRVEAAIATFFPSWAADRRLARVQLQAAERMERLGFRGARHSPLDRPAPGGGSADWHAEVEWDRRRGIDRARQLERDSVLADGLLSRSAENVVGVGFRHQARTDSKPWNARNEGLWNDWAEREADVRGLSTFNDLLSLAHRSKLRDGDVGAILLGDGSLQMIESDQIASPVGMSYRADMVDGIKLDRRGRPLTFYVVDAFENVLTPERQSVSGRIEVPADQMVYLARRKRLGQTRGLTAFSNIGWILDQIDGNIEAVTTAARMAACIGLVIGKKGRFSGLEEDEDRDGVTRRQLKLRPGMIQEVDQGDEVHQIDPKQPTTNFPEFLATLGRFVGMAFGLPLEVAFLDFSRTNYSNARAALLAAWLVWQVEQIALKRFATRIRNWKTIEWMERGLLPVRADALKHTWQAPGWRWVDPEAEISAALAAVDAGFDTCASVAQRMGVDFEELLAARKLELDAMKKAGIEPVRSMLTRDPTPKPAPGEAPRVAA